MTASSQHASHRKWWSKLLRFALWTVAILIVVELTVRVFFAISIGPNVLFYGTGYTRNHQQVTRHENKLGTYSKYFPNQVRYDRNPETGESFRVNINNAGFRGPDFYTKKEPNLLRVITLGASSTFGYYCKDEETYPHYLQQILNENCNSDAVFEVINLGVPHLRSEEILNLFLAEGLPLDPDFVTFYEGVNDSQAASRNSLRARARRSNLRSIINWSRLHLLTVKLVHESFSSWSKKYPEEELNKRIVGRSEAFIANLGKILETAQRDGFVFIVANQQAKSGILARQEIKGISYQQEEEIVSGLLAKDGELELGKLHFLVHASLMRDLRSWASAQDIPFVDVISELDSDRSVLLSWVHLNPQGNKRVAHSLARPILKAACPNAKVPEL